METPARATPVISSPLILADSLLFVSAVLWNGFGVPSVRKKKGLLLSRSEQTPWCAGNSGPFCMLHIYLPEGLGI